MKIIKILIILLIIVLGIFIFYFFTQKKDTDIQQTNTQESNTSFLEELFKKDTTKNTPTTTQKEPPILKEEIYLETTIIKSLEENILNWSQTKKFEYLESALLMTYENLSNESSFEPWKKVLRVNSYEFVQSLNKNSSQEILLSAHSIYEWFINLSGEYEKLTPTEKQRISIDFMQIQLYINSK